MGKTGDVVVFRNPTAESDEEEDAAALDPTAVGAAAAGKPASALRFSNPLAGREEQDWDGERSPSSPSPHSPLSPGFAGDGDDDGVLGAVHVDDERVKRTGRDECAYHALTVGIAVLLPIYSLLALFATAMLYIIPNPMSALATLVLATVPIVLTVGRSAAKEDSESKLQLFSFMMVMTISMQLSCVVVFLLDDGRLADAFIDSCTHTVLRLCSQWSGNGAASFLPSREEICRCAGEDGSIAAGGSFSGTMASCFRGEAGSFGSKQSAGIGMFATLAIELLLARLAWGMMVDLDVKEHTEAASAEGGAPTGKLRGTIVCGLNLRSENQNIEHLKRNYKVPAQEISCRCAVLRMKTDGLSEGHEHKLQHTITGNVDDDNSPIWNHEFEDWRT